MDEIVLKYRSGKGIENLEDIDNLNTLPEYRKKIKRILRNKINKNYQRNNIKLMCIIGWIALVISIIIFALTIHSIRAHGSMVVLLPLICLLGLIITFVVFKSGRKRNLDNAIKMVKRKTNFCCELHIYINNRPYYESENCCTGIVLTTQSFIYITSDLEKTAIEKEKRENRGYINPIIGYGGRQNQASKGGRFYAGGQNQYVQNPLHNNYQNQAVFRQNNEQQGILRLQSPHQNSGKVLNVYNQNQEGKPNLNNPYSQKSPHPNFNPQINNQGHLNNFPPNPHNYNNNQQVNLGNHLMRANSQGFGGHINNPNMIQPGTNPYSQNLNQLATERRNSFPLSSQEKNTYIKNVAELNKKNETYQVPKDQISTFGKKPKF